MRRWRVQPDHNGCPVIRRKGQGDGEIVCYFLLVNDAKQAYQRTADADLIVAAPELLEAARDVLERPCDQTRRALRYQIDRAEGRHA